MVKIRTPRPLNVTWPPPLVNKEDDDAMKSANVGASSSSSFHEAVSDLQELRDDGGSSREMMDDNFRTDDERCILISDNEDSFEVELSKYSFQSEGDKRENNEQIDGTGADDLVNENASDDQILDIVRMLESDTIPDAESLVEREDDEVVKYTVSVDNTKSPDPGDNSAETPQKEVESYTEHQVGKDDFIAKSVGSASVEEDDVSDSRSIVQTELAEENPFEESSEEDSPADDKEQGQSTACKELVEEPTYSSTNEQDAFVESKVKALIEKEVPIEPKQTGESRRTPTEVEGQDHIKLTEVEGQAPSKSIDAVGREEKEAADDNIACLYSLLSDDTDCALFEDRQLVNELQAAIPPIRMSSVRASLLYKAKEMVALYKTVLENDGFSGAEGEATRHFLTQMGSELKINLGDSCDVANLKAQLLSKKNEISQLEGCVASKNEMISELRTKNISLRTKVDLLEDELDTCQTREKYEVGRLEARLSSTELLHESVYKERDELKKWKSEAEVSLKNQSKDLDQLISQNSTLLALCDEKEEFIKDLSKWKREAEETIEKQDNKLDELSFQTSHLVEVCSEQQESIKELRKWKSDAEYAMNTQRQDLKELRSQNSNLLCRCNEQQEFIEELTNWKTDAKEKLKNNDEELIKLRSQNSSLLIQWNGQQASIEEQQEKIKTLSHRLEVESYTVSRFEEDFLVHSKNMMSLKESIQAKSSEIAELKAKIDELNILNAQMSEQAKAAPSQEKEDVEKEMLTMKMNHHKEILLLKTQKQDLASKVDDLLAEQDEFQSRIEALNENVALLEKALQDERERHSEARMAVAGMEKALRVSYSDSHLTVCLEIC
ncbi:hypothetical protein HJC23_012851 [Cyclotella cryptica]|uniref:Uncharacterized protein n=1 Tax=Cyclotella cryptica TaxID=29204 RepID=A0ABD3Q2S2_9STRA